MPRAVALHAGVALAAFAAAFFVERPAAGFHLVLAVGIMPLILAAMTYFVPVLTRTGAAPAWTALAPALGLAAGLAVFAAFSTGAAWLFVAAGAGGMLAAIATGAWALWRAGEGVTAPHACLRWYLAALGCLVLALGATLLMHQWPGQYLAIKRFHLHLNTLGFVALTAFSTLQVLMPTVAAAPDQNAGLRLRRGLAVALAGALLVAAGSGWLPVLAWLGAALWLVSGLTLLAAWWRRYRSGCLAWHGAMPLLGAALAGFCALLLAGALHAAGVLAKHQATPAFLTGFLFPLVTGALTYLLPLWLRPTENAVWHAAVRQRLGRWSGACALLFLAAGLGLAAGVSGAWLPALAGVAWFAVKLPWALRASARTAQDPVL